MAAPSPRMNESGDATMQVAAHGRTFVLMQHPAALDHAFTVWDAGLGFVRYLEANKKAAAALAGRRVLELGAGLGLVSMACAALGAHALATDLPHVVDHLRSCIGANGFKLGLRPAGAGDGADGGGAGSIDAAALPWGDDDALQRVLDTYGPFDVIVGTDVVYQDRLVRPLLGTAARAALTSRGGSGSGASAPGGGVGCSSSSSVAAATSDDTPHAGDSGGGGGGGGRRRTVHVYFANEERDAHTAALFERLSRELFGAKLLPPKTYHADSAGTSLRIYEGRLKPGATAESVAAALAT
jgi:hypothetical protein